MKICIALELIEVPLEGPWGGKLLSSFSILIGKIFKAQTLGRSKFFALKTPQGKFIKHFLISFVKIFFPPLDLGKSWSNFFYQKKSFSRYNLTRVEKCVQKNCQREKEKKTFFILISFSFLMKLQPEEGKANFQIPKNDNKFSF